MIARLLVAGCNEQTWKQKLFDENALQASSPNSTIRLARLLRGRLETMDAGLWKMVTDGSLETATHACLAAAVKHSALLGDFLDLVVREQYRLFIPALEPVLWERYVNNCRDRDPEMPEWRESTIKRLRSSVFQTLAQAGYIENTRSLKLQAAHISPQVLNYLRGKNEDYVLRCIQVSP